MVRFALAHPTPIYAYAYASSGTRGLNVCLNLHLHPDFVYWSSEGSGESVHSPEPSLLDNALYTKMCFPTYHSLLDTQLEIREQRSSSYFSQNCLPLTQALQRLYRRGSFQKLSFVIFHQVETEIIKPKAMLGYLSSGRD